MSDSGKWQRVRFSVPSEDYRPVTFPPPGPYWCSGYGSDDEAILVAYVRTEDQVREFWPDSSPLHFSDECDGITFTSRFPEPAWWAAIAATSDPIEAPGDEAAP